MAPLTYLCGTHHDLPYLIQQVQYILVEVRGLRMNPLQFNGPKNVVSNSAGTLAPTAIGAQFDFIIKKIHEEKLRPCTLELLTTPVVGGG
jgi:hypothetical protein